MGFPTGMGYDARSQIPTIGESPFNRTGWWTGNNALGDTVDIEMPRNAGEAIAVTNCDKIGGPLPYSVTLNRQIVYPPRFNDIGANCDIRARIMFGSGASTQTVICDWNPGTQLAFAANSQVRIDAISYAPDPDQPYRARVTQADDSILPAIIRIGASSGMTGAPHPRPRFTQRLETLDTATDSDIIVPPPWAHAVQVLGISNSEGPVTGFIFRWIAPDGSTFGRYAGTQFNPYQFLPIPAGSRLQVRNASGSAAQLTLIWELAL